jgi:intracellular septation protein
MKGVALPAGVWTRLTWAWVGFFAFMALANWYVAFHYSEQTWVLYKVWGGIGLFVVFALVRACGCRGTCPRRPHERKRPLAAPE